MAYDLANIADRRIILGLSGGVDSAVAAFLLQDAGARVEALHMTNWEDEDGYCSAAEDLQDARRICAQLDIPLHHVNFATEYRERVFAYFLREYGCGRTPNPDVLCNREIKFGVFRDYAKRLGGEILATGHYARTGTARDTVTLLKAVDSDKDQTYFLHAVTADALAETVFPLGELRKAEVRGIAKQRGLTVHDKKDSTGICFIGERPFREFLGTYIPAQPGPIVTPAGKELGRHHGLMYYTLGQRQDLGINGRRDAGDKPWYVVGKNLSGNALIVDQGDSPLLLSDELVLGRPSWIGAEPEMLDTGLRCTAKIRYRQPDQDCTVSRALDDRLVVRFDEPQRAATPGQFVVFYQGDRCLGGAAIEALQRCAAAAPTAPEPAIS